MSILDQFLMFSEDQAVSGTEFPIKVLSENYVDLGAYGRDVWGNDKRIYPGWWKPKSLVLTVKTGALSATAPTNSSNLLISLKGTNYTTHITSGWVDYDYGYVEKVNTGTTVWYKAYKPLLVVAVPRVSHRFLFMYYKFTGTTDSGVYTKISSWISFDSQSLAVGSYPTA